MNYHTLPPECENWESHVFVDSFRDGSICMTCGRHEHGCGCTGCRLYRLQNLERFGLNTRVDVLDDIPL